MILVISAVQALLAQLTSSQSSPHSALLTSKSNGTVLAASYVPSTHPFPPASLADRDQDERNRVYAAVGGSCWTDEHGYANQITPSANNSDNDDQSTQPQQVLKVETEVSTTPLRTRTDQFELGCGR